MNGNAARLARIVAGILMVVSVDLVLIAQAARPYEHGMPTDWTHHAVVYSRPVTAEQVANAANDPRYWQQWIRHNMVRHVAVEPEAALQSAERESRLATPSFRGVIPEALRGDWSEDMGTGATVGAGNFPAKFSFSITTANCASDPKPDFVVFNTGLLASATQASIIAYDNIYSGCSGFGGNPATYWAYDTRVAGVGARVRTSPVLSLDGSQIAFVQTNNTNAKLVLLKWKANNGTLGAPVAPTNIASAANYPGCTAPCMFAINLTNAVGAQTNDITSSVYYDYTSDTAWVGDSVGLLHKFHPFFTTGAPAEIRTAPWPVQANTVAASTLSSPVYDYISGNVFVGDAGGYLSRVNNTTGANATSARIDIGTNGIVSYPLLDVNSNKLYAFVSNDASTACTAGAPCAGVFQFSTTFAASSSGTEQRVGVSKAAPNGLYPGAFDQQYYTSGNSTGNMYVCGNTGANPILYQLPVNAGVMQAATALSTVTTNASTAACSPVTDIQNPNLTGGAEERVFVSPRNNGRPTACATRGCLISFINSPWKKSTAYAPNQKVLVGTQIQVAAGTTTQTSGAAAPTWNATAGGTTADGGVTWVNQGAITAVPYSAWSSNHNYNALQTTILGSNGYLEIVITTGRSTNGAEPAWTTRPGDVTNDNTVRWINAGTLPTAATQAIGGTSGIIMDNVVGAATKGGASQVYFGTLGNEACNGGTGGCAVQAGQATLQ